MIQIIFIYDKYINLVIVYLKHIQLLVPVFQIITVKQI